MAINRNVLKTYAPKARLDFIQTMTNRAALFGITKDGVSDGQLQGEVYIVEGRPWPKAVAEQRRRLVARIRQTSFDQVMEAVAYTWFNRFLAIRYMELHDYFDHGFRVLSSPTGQAEPQILTEAAHLDLPGLKRDEIVRLKLDGTQDEALYRKILIAQCNDLHRAMPFLFEKIEDETELLLPENLLQSDSIVRKLVTSIEEAEWDQIEIIGWLYQFYISDKKDQVIGKVVKSEDIPAATQLFTPNWIVKYMVQNSLGATWLGTYPDSAIKAHMEYYIEPAEQTPEVNAQLAQITPKALDPEALTLIDPACGSGHILVEAYDLFKAIYLERGYSAREAARLILTKNLYGLDIDDRAAQMAGFALMMRARADDRSLLRDPPGLNVLSIQESNGIDADAMIDVLLPRTRVELIPSGDLLPETLAQPTLAVTTNADAGHQTSHGIRGLLETFQHAKTYGALITVPGQAMATLPLIEALLNKPAPTDLLRRGAYQDAADALRTLLEQAKLLGRAYHCVVANPPYMGSGGLNPNLKNFAAEKFSLSKYDLFSMFIERGLNLTYSSGFNAMVTMQSWMFLSSYENFRAQLLSDTAVTTMCHMTNGVMGIAFGTSATIWKKAPLNHYKGLYFQTAYENVSKTGIPDSWPPNNARNQVATEIFGTRGFFPFSASDVRQVPGNPIVYWMSETARNAFNAPPLSTFATFRAGLQTGDNNTFLRYWHEIDKSSFNIDCKSRDEAKESRCKWFPLNKGGGFRKWSGNRDFVINWRNDGEDIKAKKLIDLANGKITANNSKCWNQEHYFKNGLTWSSLTSGEFSLRDNGSGYLFDTKGQMLFGIDKRTQDNILLFLNSSVASYYLSALSPTLDFNGGVVSLLPFLKTIDGGTNGAERLRNIAEADWNSFEISWDFSQSPLLVENFRGSSLAFALHSAREFWADLTQELRDLEIANNARFIELFGLHRECSKDVPLSKITLDCNPYFRYGSGVPEIELAARLNSDTMRELISYAVGCILGRYSLAEPGLIYAHAGNEGFDLSRYGAFPADGDGIIPITEDAWFDDDVAQRIEEFLGVAWPDSAVADNLGFLVDGLIKGQSDDPRGDLRDYLSKKFYSDHLQTYKNRPIYWLFSSGKLKAFECLVYLHRYNEGTLARMRTEYVTPLMGKMSARIEGLEQESATSSSSADKTAKTRAVTKLRKQLEELRAFDEELHHLADQRIALDLDDGVKVNYGRFGNLLAFKTKVCGKDESE